MTSYNPPSQILGVFNPYYFLISDESLTLNSGDKRYVKLTSNQNVYGEKTFLNNTYFNTITSTGDLILNPVGSISCNGKNLEMTNGEIHNCPLIHSQNNNNIIVEGKGNGNVILKTNNVNALTVDQNQLITLSGPIQLNSDFRQVYYLRSYLSTSSYATGTQDLRWSNSGTGYYTGGAITFVAGTNNIQINIGTSSVGMFAVKCILNSDTTSATNSVNIILQYRVSGVWTTWSRIEMQESFNSNYSFYYFDTIPTSVCTDGLLKLSLVNNTGASFNLNASSGYSWLNIYKIG